MVIARNGALYVYFYPFGSKEKVGLKLPNIRGKREADRVEMAILTACRSGCYSGLDAPSREACIRMFRNRKRELPPELRGISQPKKELTLWDSCEIFIKDPEIHNSPSRWRHEYSLEHLLKNLGKDRPVKSIWVSDLKRYRVSRLNEGAADTTVNRELATLSKLFGILIEHQLVEVNPVHSLKRLPTKSGERQVYLSWKDVQRIADRCPEWYRLILVTAFHTGMRRGEILGLTRKQINLSTRIMVLSPEGTKEAHWKRVPIHPALLPLLEETLDVSCLGTDRVFLLKDAKGIRPLDVETFKNVWPRACKALELKRPWPRFHDLRHTWRTNARRSGIDPQIAEAILGHQDRARTVNERYGRISDAELVQAIDAMTFEHGETEILVAREVSERPSKSSNSVVTGGWQKRKGPASPGPKC